MGGNTSKALLKPLNKMEKNKTTQRLLMPSAVSGRSKKTLPRMSEITALPATVTRANVFSAMSL